MDKKLCNNNNNNNNNSSSHDPEVRKGPWTMEEDLILINYIANHGEGVWNSLAKAAGLKRTGKSCRLRWLNYLRPDVRRGNITPEEQLLIMELHAKWGNRWSKIAKHLPGRTDNEIKNYWRTRIQKHIKQADHHQNFQQQQQQQTSNNSSDQMMMNIDHHHHHQATTSCHVSTFPHHHEPSMEDTYSPPPSNYHHQAFLEPFSSNQFIPSSIPDHSTCCSTNDSTYWSMDDIWPSMQLLNGD